MTHAIERIPDSLGYLILTEDGAVQNSGGDLENDEQMAEKIMTILRWSIQLSCQSSGKPVNFKKLSIVWESHSYTVTLSNHRVFIIKRRSNPIEPVAT